MTGRLLRPWFVYLLAAVAFLVGARPLGAATRPAGAVLAVGRDGNGTLTTADGNGLAVTARPAVVEVRLAASGWNPNELDHETINDEKPHLDPYSGWRPTTEAGATEPTDSAFDAASGTCTQTYAWGTLSVGYGPAGQLDVTVANTSSKWIQSIRIDLMEIDWPEAAKPQAVSTLPGWARDGWNIDGPRVIRLDGQPGRLVLFGRSFDGPYRQELARNAKGKGAGWVARLGIGGAEELYDGVWNSRPIGPGASVTVHLAVGVGPAEADPYALAAEAYKTFAKVHPMTLTWADRRPIASIFVASNHATSPTNPRAWTHAGNPPKDADLRTEAGRAAFAEAMAKSADRILGVCRGKGAQGVVVWNIAGEQYKGPIYYGEPRVIEKIAPEMDAAADAFFQRLRDGGLRVGVCIRPQLVFARDANDRNVPFEQIETLAGRNWVQAIPAFYRDLYADAEAHSPLERLSAKIAYAKKRWGCTLFYVDTNHFWRPRDRSVEKWKWGSKMLPAEVFRQLHKRHPDVLILPEHESLAYFACSAPLGVVPGYGGPTGGGVRIAYPRSWGVLMTSGKGILERKDAYVRGVTSGDALMPPGWYGGGGETIQAVYGASVEGIAHRVHLAGDGALSLNGQAVASATELGKKLATATDNGRADWARRRVLLTHAEGIAGQKLREAVDAIAASGAILAWSQPKPAGR